MEPLRKQTAGEPYTWPAHVGDLTRLNIGGGKFTKDLASSGLCAGTAECDDKPHVPGSAPPRPNQVDAVSSSGSAMPDASPSSKRSHATKARRHKLGAWIVEGIALILATQRRTYGVRRRQRTAQLETTIHQRSTRNRTPPNTALLKQSSQPFPNPHLSKHPIDLHLLILPTTTHQREPPHQHLTPPI